MYHLERRKSSGGCCPLCTLPTLPWAALGSLYEAAPAAEFPKLVLHLPPTGNGAVAKGGTAESLHTTPWGWAVPVGSPSPSVWLHGLQATALVVRGELPTLLLHTHLSVCSSRHGKWWEVMFANSPVFEVLNTPSQDPACFDKVNYPFWNVLGSLPCSFSWALCVPAGCCFNTDTSLVPLHPVCAGHTAGSQGVLRTQISGALQRDPPSVFQFKVALDLCSLEKDTCGRKVIKNCLLNETCQGFAVHRSTLAYFWKSLTPFPSFCMTMWVLYGTVVEEILNIICVNHGAHHVVSNLRALALCHEGRWQAGKSWELFS